MIYFILSLIIITLSFIIFILFQYKRYDHLLEGCIVGKYKGNSKGGYVVVEVTYQVNGEDEWSPPTKVTDSGIFEVPSFYYDNCKIGDKGIFPFKVEGQLKEH